MITAGRGRMWVKEEEWEVGSGDIFIPPRAVPGIEYASAEVLNYVSAAPALDAGAAYERGRLRSEE